MFEKKKHQQTIYSKTTRNETRNENTDRALRLEMRLNCHITKCWAVPSFRCQHNFEINHYGSPGRMEGSWLFWGKRHQCYGVWSFLSKAPHTRFLGLEYVPGGHRNLFPSPTAEGIPKTQFFHVNVICESVLQNKHKAITDIKYWCSLIKKNLLSIKWKKLCTTAEFFRIRKSFFQKKESSVLFCVITWRLEWGLDVRLGLGIPKKIYWLEAQLPEVQKN